MKNDKRCSKCLDYEKTEDKSHGYCNNRQSEHFLKTVGMYQVCNKYRGIDEDK